MRLLRAVCAAALLLLAAGPVLFADILVLRDGRRVEGTLTSVRGDTIEFEDAGGRMRRYDREDVRSIQFDDEGRTAGRRFDDTGSSRSAMRERAVTLDARTPWTDSGVDVRAGQEISFTATGQVRWGPNRRDGAGGENNSPRNDGRPMPNRNAAALIGKLGENGDPFFIGDQTQPMRLRGSGRLFLGLNDDYLNDNSGSLRVVVYY